MPSESFDRAARDVGAIVCFEHVNLRVPDQLLATTFYIEGLELTRDPYYMVGIDNVTAVNPNNGLIRCGKKGQCSWSPVGP